MGCQTPVSSFRPSSKISGLLVSTPARTSYTHQDSHEGNTSIRKITEKSITPYSCSPISTKICIPRYLTHHSHIHSPSHDRWRHATDPSLPSTRLRCPHACHTTKQPIARPQTQISYMSVCNKSLQTTILCF